MSIRSVVIKRLLFCVPPTQNKELAAVELVVTVRFASDCTLSPIENGYNVAPPTGVNGKLMEAFAAEAVEGYVTSA